MSERRGTMTSLAMIGVLLALGMAGGVQAQPAPAACAPATEADVGALFDRWNASLATLDPARVAANYAPDAVLLPTLSSGPLVGRDAITGYFTAFLRDRPQGAIDRRAVKVGCNAAHDAGLYTFTFRPADGAARRVAARYSFVYAFHDGQWLIAHHHSSVIP